MYEKAIRIYLETEDVAVINTRNSAWGSDVKLHKKIYMHISPQMGLIPPKMWDLGLFLEPEKDWTLLINTCPAFF